MPEFPQKESEIAALADTLYKGLLANMAIYPSPPVHPATINAKRQNYLGKRSDSIQAHAEAESATATKDDTLADLIDAMKDDLRYAENTVDFDDDKLKLIGWAGKGAPTPLAVPGQPRVLEAPREGEGWIFLDWKAPVDGGSPSAYKIMRRERPEGPWENVGTAVETEMTMTDQERGKEFEYRVIAINKAGESEPSNTVMAVL